MLDPDIERAVTDMTADERAALLAAGFEEDDLDFAWPEYSNQELVNAFRAGRAYRVD